MSWLATIKQIVAGLDISFDLNSLTHTHTHTHVTTSAVEEAVMAVIIW
jgi:hypothetical protein